MPNITYDESKLAELILYISSKSALDPNFGATKLNKILYFSDFVAYGRFGQAITGAEYQNLTRGPAPRRLLPVRAKLQEEQALAIQPVFLANGLIQHRPINLREPDLSLFKASEISLVDSIIGKLSVLNATEASDLSHLDVGWKATKEGETIAYGTVFLSGEKVTDAERKRAREIAIEEGLIAA